MTSLDSLTTTALATMCYYEMYLWECNDWRWGNFKQHCEKEYRMGETCGIKMIYRTQNVPGCCKLCEEINRKKRKHEKARADFDRFKRDPQRQATAEVRLEEIQALEIQIKTLQDNRLAKMTNVGNSRRSDSVMAR